MNLVRAVLLTTLAAFSMVAAAEDSADVAAAKQTIVDYYAAWAAHDVARYRSLCTPDYLILDDGEMSNLDQDIAYLRAHPEAWRGRTDHFDFRDVRVRGDEAVVVYFLNSEIRNGQAVEHKRYLESAILRRNAKGWQVFLLHSTRLAAAPEKDASETADAEIRAAMAWAMAKPNSPDPSAPPSLRAPKPNPREIVHVPGSTRSYTRAQLDAGDSFPDWFPGDHPPAPRIVMEHDKPGFPLPCADCHWPNGQGDITSPPLAGLPEAYIVEQITAFRQGTRAVQVMAKEARSITDSDMQLAAGYFSKLLYTPRVRPVETATVPETHWSDFVLVPNSNGAREPIGKRIIETPVDVEAREAGDDHVESIAWVPPGSIERGETIASKGIGTAAACESCHGGKLQGVGNIPPLAGRPPTYIVRELIRFRLGQRTNPGAAPMRFEVSHLTLEDMIDVAAYAASRKPST